jgi:hypothetical protein
MGSFRRAKRKSADKQIWGGKGMGKLVKFYLLR